MDSKLSIIKSNENTYLCYKDGKNYFNVSNPMLNFTEGVDMFEIIPPDESYQKKKYEYEGRKVYIEPLFYENDWPALAIANLKRQIIDIITVNLTEDKAFDIPNKAFVDINNHPEAMKLLIENELAKDSYYRKKNSFVEYPMLLLNLPLLYQHKPSAFEEHVSAMMKINTSKKAKKNINNYLHNKPVNSKDKKANKKIS